MGLRVNTNVASVNAQRNLYDTNIKLGKSLERLSSGLRINRAGDDAAGLAISESLRGDIRAYQQASRNASDGISMVQTAEGALAEVSNITVRLKELAEQAANETIGSTERGFLNQEFEELLNEITRIASTTEFNGAQLLDGTGGTLDIQVGISAGATNQISIGFGTTVNASSLGLTVNTISITGTDSTNALAALTAVDNAVSTVTSTRASFGAAQNRLETTVRNLGVAVENFSAANSRIRDVDIAAETANLTSLQILQQAGISVLAQANFAPQAALSLLG